MIISREDKEFILANEDEDISTLALMLNKSKLDKRHIGFVLNQVIGRRISKTKIETWYNNEEVIYPPHLSMEQSSSELTAMYKTTLIDSENSILDITGGLGVDFYFLAKKASEATYLEQSKELCEIAEHNFNALGLKNYTIINGIGEDYLKTILPNDRVIYIDPARRDDHGKKVFMVEDCTPNIIDIQDEMIQKSSKCIIKFSPMLDISLALNNLKNIDEVHVVSVENDCKELLFVSSAEREKELNIYTTNIKKNGVEETFSFRYSEEEITEIAYTDTLNKYLYEPNSSILKAGAFKSIAKHFGILKLSPNSHIYTSDLFIEDFPGRVFMIDSYFSPNKKNIKEFVKINHKANITVRNYPMSVAEIRNANKLKEGGDIYVFASTLNSGKKVWIICRKV